MTLDRFGEELYTGDIVVYADTNVGGDSLSLDVYLVTQLVDAKTCIGQLMSGRYAGNSFYLTDTISRCAYMTEGLPRPDDEDEEDGFDSGFPTLPRFH